MICLLNIEVVSVLESVFTASFQVSQLPRECDCLIQRCTKQG